jgi:hypothetical protein
MRKKLKPFASLWTKVFDADPALLPARPAEIIRAKEDIAAYVYARRAVKKSAVVLLILVSATLITAVFSAQVGAMFALASILIGRIPLMHVSKMLKSRPDSARREQIEEYFGESLFLVAVSAFGPDALQNKMWTPDEFVSHLHTSLTECVDRKSIPPLNGDEVEEVLIQIALRVLVGEMLSRFFPDEHEKGRSQEWKSLLMLINSIASDYGYRAPRVDDVFAEAQRRLDSADDA